jgi:hypothetical protein
LLFPPTLLLFPPTFLLFPPSLFLGPPEACIFICLVRATTVELHFFKRKEEFV